MCRRSRSAIRRVKMEMTKSDWRRPVISRKHPFGAHGMIIALPVSMLVWAMVVVFLLSK
jgi:hypothetical protein